MRQQALTNKMPSNYKTDYASRALLAKIAQRATKIAKTAGWDYNMLDIIHDLNRVHKKCMALDFSTLFNSSDNIFIHDIFGIRKNLNRKFNRLDNQFIPHCTSKKMFY